MVMELSHFLMYDSTSVAWRNKNENETRIDGERNVRNRSSGVGIKCMMWCLSVWLLLYITLYLPLHDNNDL